jgi:SAM-dependent methyltransferase
MIKKRDCLKRTFFDTDNIFEYDSHIYTHIRSHISETIRSVLCTMSANDKILEIGPSSEDGSPSTEFVETNVDTLDIVRKPKLTFVTDITSRIETENLYDFVFLMDVLEHTTNPQDALSNVISLLNTNGTLVVSVPYGFRLHGPLPDMYRISEYGLRHEMIKNDLDIVRMECIYDESRPCLPIHYVCIARKIKR